MVNKQTIATWRKAELMALNMMKHGFWPGNKVFYEDLIGFESHNEYLNFLAEIGFFRARKPAYCKQLTSN
jgi:hypothetical protein